MTSRKRPQGRSTEQADRTTGEDRTQAIVHRGRSKRSTEKLQRWMDLFAALLGRHYPVTLEDLVRDVPGYARSGLSKAALCRTFERDKADLRALGAPLETIVLDDGESVGYRLSAQQFYLPYLVLAVHRTGVLGRSQKNAHRYLQTEPRRVDRYGYRALPTLLFEPEELRYVFTAGRRIEILGDITLAETATNALRKLRFDLPVGAASAFAERIVPPRALPHRSILTTLWRALAVRKRVVFIYHSIGADEHTQRNIEPYGLFLNSGHWYLVGRDVERSALRTFRVNRISDVHVNAIRAQIPDYDIPLDFALHERIHSKQAWEIGDGDAVDAVVEFHGDVGAITAAARLGVSEPGTPRRRRFQVRRVDTFARWLLSFGGDAQPILPEVLCHTYIDMARRTLALYKGRIPSGGKYVTPAFEIRAKNTTISPRATAPKENVAAPSSTTAKFQRLLAALPEFNPGDALRLDELAERTGMNINTLIEDFEELTSRDTLPAGFVEGVQVYFEHDRVSIIAPQFLRPTRLTATELCALELGLAMLRRESPPDEQPWIDRARTRLRDAIMSLPPAILAELPDAPHSLLEAGALGVSISDDSVHLIGLRRALEARRKLRLVYSAGGSAAIERIVHPYTLLFASGNWHLIAYCETRLTVRQFRLDRIGEVELLSASYEMPIEYTHSDDAADRRVDTRPIADNESARSKESMQVRYSPHVARWIAEREGQAPDSDGSLTLAHPIADPQWAVRHILQYGPEAEVLSPEWLRLKIASCLEGIGVQAQ